MRASGSDKVFVQIESEEGSYVVEMSKEDAATAKKLLTKAMRSDEWPDEVNTIIDRSKKLRLAGTINTMGDGWGWYK